jgi:hypothetical protein
MHGELLVEPVWTGLLNHDQRQSANDDSLQQRVVVGYGGGDQPVDYHTGDGRIRRSRRAGSCDPCRYPPPSRRLPRRHRAATERHGIDWTAVRVWVGSDSTADQGDAGAAAVLASTPRPTALLCLSDRLAEGALRAAARFGLLIPDGLSVVAFDDPVPLAAHSQPDRRPAAQPQGPVRRPGTPRPPRRSPSPSTSATADRTHNPPLQRSPLTPHISGSAIAR